MNDALPTLPGDIANPGGAGVVAGSAEWICTGTDHLTVNQTLSDTDLSGTRGVTVSPDGLWAAATGQDADSVILYQRDPASGGLTLVEVVSDGDSIVDEDDVEIGVVTGPGRCRGCRLQPGSAPSGGRLQCCQCRRGVRVRQR